MRFATTLKQSGIALLFLWSSALADGYRPESPLGEDFVAGLSDAAIVVFPTIVRDPYVVGYSTMSQQLVVDYFDKHELARASAAERAIELDVPPHKPQFELFMDSLGNIAEEAAKRGVQSDYALVLEVLFPPAMGRGLEVFGIHVFIVTPGGENAFSFLLNSHHTSFNRAGLSSPDTSAKGREKLVMKSTTVALAALKEQITQVQSCAPIQGAAFPMLDGTGVVEDFDSELVASTEGNGIAIGFSTFNGNNSRAWMSVTQEHPALPEEAAGNGVLQVDLDVNSWAGVLHRFADDATTEWIAYDWSGARELSFWLYGNDSGTTLVVDVLDNRHRCSIRDDAERYSYEFPDNFSGWQLIAIPFEVMTRKDIGNGAPNDGLGLVSVNGWGFAALRTHGARTYYIDDVRVRQVPVLEDIPAGPFRDEYVWSPINELPMYGNFNKTAWQEEADEKFLAMTLTRFDGDHEAAAEQFARMGWNLYYKADRSSAIKRFNQAWLLDADNRHALWGFAVISRERGKFDDALRFYEMALEKGPENPTIRGEYEQLGRIVTPTQH
jgi:hypothetical protein